MRFLTIAGSICLVSTSILLCSNDTFGDAIDAAILEHLPVREVTVFKDGHAFVIHHGETSLNEHGNITFDSLPTPVLGTFWAFSNDPDADIHSVTASKQPIARQRDALSIVELLEHNVGRLVSVVLGDQRIFRGEIIRLTSRTAGATHGNPPPFMLHLGTDAGIRILDARAIEQLVFREHYESQMDDLEEQHTLGMKLAWRNSEPRDTADVGMMYLQKGLRWIPNYRVTLIDDETARIELQATILNELADLDEVVMHLVIGVPNFEFDHTLDPIAIQGRLTQLSAYFDSAGTGLMSQAMLGQMARHGEIAHDATVAADFDAEIITEAEDLYLFTLADVTLAHGERMVLPIVTFDVPYEDVYVLDLPLVPPDQIAHPHTSFGSSGSTGNADHARRLAAPKVMHELQLTNTSRYPFTTAPAMIIRDGRPIAQGLLHYTAVGGTTNHPVTAAMDVRVDRDEYEVGREPVAIRIQGRSAVRIDMEGRLSIKNYRRDPVSLDVRRRVIGIPGDVSTGGTAERLNVLEHRRRLTRVPLPSWWSAHNSLIRFRWTLTLEPGESIDLTYAWHSFWRQ